MQHAMPAQGIAAAEKLDCKTVLATVFLWFMRARVLIGSS
jgi:hypothetical protein